MRALIPAAVLIGVLGWTAAFAAAPAALAQPSEQPTVSIDFKDAPIRDALNALKRQFPEFSYVLDQRVTGSVTLSLRDTSLANALRLMVGSVGAAYTVDNGVYVIAPPAPAPAPVREAPKQPTLVMERPAPTPGGAAAQPTGKAGEETTEGRITRLVRVKHVDPADVAAVFGGQVILGESRLNSGGFGGYGGYGGYGGGYGGYGGGYGGYGGGYGGYGGGYGGYGGQRGIGGFGGGFGGRGFGGLGYGY